MPLSFAKSPKNFTERTIASVGIVATESTGLDVLVASTKIVFNETMRTIYFVIPSDGINKYDVRCIIDIDTNPAKSSDSNGVSENTKGKNSKSKTAE
jgi:hypothetical protein